MTTGASAPLFRHEVLQARQAQWLGSIRIARPPSFAWVTGVSLTLALMLIAFAVWGEVARKATVPGLLMPLGGLIQVSAPQAGVISEWLVREGDAVQANQPLLHIKSERHTAQGEAGALNLLALGQRRTSLQAERRLNDQQSRQRHDALSERLRSLQAEERQAQAELDTSTLRVNLARQTLQRYQDLAASGFVSLVQAQQKQEELLDVQTRQSNAQRAVQALQRDVQSLLAEQQANAAAAKASQVQMDRALASLGQEDAEHSARQGITVTAPQAGRISATTQTAGQTVQAGQTLLSLVPESATGAAQLEAQLFAPARKAGFIEPGQTVWLRYAAYPYQKFGMAQGTVVQVSDSPLSPQDLPAGQAQALQVAAQSNEPLRRIHVRVADQTVNAYGQALPLKAGAVLEADVVQERRAVWEWVFEPLLAARHQFKVLSASPNKTSPGG
jgi:membrane fusion protein